MSVITTVTPGQLKRWLRGYGLGALLDLKGITSGITNTNYFVTTTSGRYVLTLFEHQSAAELPYFLNLMAHLADRGIPCPRPIAANDGAYFGEMNDKPAALVSCLHGTSIEKPSAAQCAQVGEVLARMHLAGQSYLPVMENSRGVTWCAATAIKLMPLLQADERHLLESELVFQAGFHGADLPRGVIHADLFRDNVLFDGDDLGGLIDFYYACNDLLTYDLAITINDWCVHENGALDEGRTRTMMEAYREIRPLTVDERSALPALLRAAALRFWLSRLYDLHFPPVGNLIYTKDPGHFKRVLAARIHEGKQLLELWA